MSIGCEFELTPKQRGASTRRDLRLRCGAVPDTLPVVFQILGEGHGRHAAFAEVGLDAVAVGEGGRELGGDLGQFPTFAFNSSKKFSTTINSPASVDARSRIMTNR